MSSDLGIAAGESYLGDRDEEEARTNDSTCLSVLETPSDFCVTWFGACMIS